MKILITASNKYEAKNYVNYLKSVGETFVATPEERVSMKDFDLLVLSGGKDVNPALYGEERKYDNVEVDERRDEMEFALIEESLRLNKPIFGICRGFQILTVYFGGSLYQDLKSEGFPDIHEGEDSEDSIHGVVFSGMFERIFGEKGTVNSNHHQGMKGFPERLPDGEILAVSEDHLVEAFMSKRFRVLAVQWHPERHRSEISEKLKEMVKGL